jgi:hypothetical protein
VLAEGPDRLSGLSVSNSLSGGDSALNEVPAVRDPNARGSDRQASPCVH